MATPLEQLQYTEEEYLKMERASEERHEYIDGYIYAMAGESHEHADISMNIAGLLFPQLRGTNCRGRIANTKVRSGPRPRVIQSRKGLYSYPDIFVVCGELESLDEHQDVIINPTVIFEVLSSSTENNVRGEKFLRYQNYNPSLRDYILVSQTSPTIEHYSRQSDGSWTYRVYQGLKAGFSIKSIKCSLKLAEVYERVKFPSEKQGKKTVAKKMTKRKTAAAKEKKMIKCTMSLSLIGIILLAILSNGLSAQASGNLAVGAAAPEFELKDLSGQPHALKSYRGKTTVLTFISARCPISKMYQDRIRAVADDYAKQGVAFLAINANADEPVAEVRAHAEQNKLNFTILKDEGNVVADAYAAERTPTVYVVDKDGMLRYQGRIDNSQNERQVKRKDLREALNELLAGKAVSVPETKAMGCVIKRSQSPTAKVTATVTTADPNVVLLKPAAFSEVVKKSAGKVLIVNFWATWCGPCVAEFPEFVKLDQTYRDKGVRFVHISADDATDLKSKVIPFLKEQKAQSDQFLQDTEDPQEMIDQVFKEWSGALPATFVYDKTGKMVFHQFGIIDRDKMIELIEQNLKS